MIDLKSKLRGRLRDRYKELDFEYKNSADKRIIERLIHHDLYETCNTIFMYASIGNEVDTHSLLHIAYQQGKTIALPKCKNDGQMEFFRYDGRLEEGRYRIPEPQTNEIIYPGDKDIMIIPGLAFDSRGYRIGQGGGYYDRYLEKHTCVSVGVCRESFLLNEVPICWNDLPVDYVITENNVYQCKNGVSEETPLV